MSRDLLHYEKRTVDLEKDGYTVISKGFVDEKLSTTILGVSRLYSNIHIQEDFYELPEEYGEFTSNWSDIEGMDYGWAWANFEGEDGEIDFLALKEHLYNNHIQEHLEELRLNGSKPLRYIHYSNGKEESFELFEIDEFEMKRTWSFSNEELY